MTKPKDIISKLEECIHIAKNYDVHIKSLTNQVASLAPSQEAVINQLKKAGFDTETAPEDNLHALLDHHAKLVAENTRLHRIISDRDELMEKLREVVKESVD